MNVPRSPADPGSKERLRLWLRLLKLTRNVDLGVRDRLRQEFDTTLPRFDLLSALSRHPSGLKMSRLSDVLRVSNGNVTGLVDRLAEEQQVERVPVPGDRRAMMVRLTKSGANEFARQAAAHEAWVDELLAAFSDTEARDLARLLGQKTENKETDHAQ